MEKSPFADVENSTAVSTERSRRIQTPDRPATLAMHMEGGGEYDTTSFIRSEMGYQATRKYEPHAQVSIDFHDGPKEAKALFDHMRPDLRPEQEYVGRYFETWEALDKRVRAKLCAGAGEDNAPSMTQRTVLPLKLVTESGHTEILGAKPRWEEPNSVVLRAETEVDGNTVGMNFSDPKRYQEQIRGQYPDANIQIRFVAGPIQSLRLYEAMAPEAEDVSTFYKTWSSRLDREQKSKTQELTASPRTRTGLAM